MSREKVDKYKEKKANRKQDAVKERARRKRNKFIGFAIVCAIIAVVAAAIIVTGINEYQLRKAAEPDYESATSLIISDLTGILTEDTGEEDESSEDASSEDEATEDTDNETSEDESAD